MKAIDRPLSRTRRLEEIIRVLVRFGLADWLKSSRLDWLQSMFKGAVGEALIDLTTEQRVRLAITELGTTFIKVAQILSTRADLIGPALAEELRELQANTPPDPPEVACRSICDQLGAMPDRLFATFDDRPLASASIGQVHAATLFDGTRVVVKIQHPGIEDRIRSDLDILDSLAHLAERHSEELSLFRPVALVDQFRRILMQELDFTREARNLEHLSANFASDERVIFPTPFQELSGRRVLTMKRLDGDSLLNRQALEERGHDLSKLARRGADVYMEMVFRDGFFHADPHPGNILVLPNDVIGLLDGGMVGILDPNRRQQFGGLIQGIVTSDSGLLLHHILQIGSPPETLDSELLRLDVAEFVNDHMGVSVEQLDLSEALSHFTSIVRKHRIHLPPDVAMLLKLLVMLEGTARLLNPDFSLAEVAERHSKSLMIRSYSPAELASRLRRSLREWELVIDRLPNDISYVIDRVRRGTFAVHLQHRRLATTVNRLIYGVLVASLFVSAALLAVSHVPPIVFGTSLYSLLCAFFALILVVRLLRAIETSGGLGRLGESGD